MQTVYVSESNVIVSDSDLRSTVRNLECVGLGVSRTVYDLGDGTVLKIRDECRSNAGNNLTEWEAWQSIKDGPYAKHFAEVIAVSETGDWLIQRKVCHSLEDDFATYFQWWEEEGREVVRTLDLADIHPGNVGITTQGNVVIIDFAFPGGFQGSFSGEQECGPDCSECHHTPTCRNCGACDCAYCKPEGCDCAEFAGCNVRECDVEWCYEEAETFVKHEAFQGTDVAVCSGHRPNERWQRELHRDRDGEGLSGKGQLWFRICLHSQAFHRCNDASVHN